MGIWDGAGATKSWLHSGTLKRSPLPRWKQISTRTQFSIWMIREMVNDDDEACIGDTKKIILMRKKMWCHAISIPCCESVIFLLNFFEFCWTALEISVFLYFSVPQCEGWLWLLLICCSKLQNSFRKWQSPCEIWTVEQLNSKIDHSLRIQLFYTQFSLFTVTLAWFVSSSLPWFHCAL